MTQRPRLSNRVVFAVDAPRAAFWRGRDLRRLERSRVVADRTDSEHAHTRRRHVVGRRRPRRHRRDRGSVDAPDLSLRERLLQHRFRRTEPGLGRDGSAGRRARRRDPERAGRVRERSDIHRDQPQRPVDRRDVASESTRRPFPPKWRLGTRNRRTPRPAYARWRVRSPRGPPTTFDKVLALEAWLGAHVKYSITAPLAPQGVDVVDDFLFRSRLGWCEQVASSLVVLARSVGIPARLATGFVPGTPRFAHGPVRRTRARRARLDGDLLPGRRLAAVRPDGVGAARGRRVARAVRGCKRRGTTRSSSVCSRSRSSSRSSRRPTSSPACVVAARAPARGLGGARSRPARAHRSSGRPCPRTVGDTARVRGGAGRTPRQRRASERSATRSTPTDSPRPACRHPRAARRRGAILPLTVKGIP